MFETLFLFGKKAFWKKDWTFTGQILTNGFAATVLFSRPGGDGFVELEDFIETTVKVTEEDDYNPYAAFKGFKVVGCDPGKVDLLTMIDDSGARFRFSSAQRRHETTIRRKSDVDMDLDIFNPSSKQKRKYLGSEYHIVKSSKTVLKSVYRGPQEWLKGCTFEEIQDWFKKVRQKMFTLETLETYTTMYFVTLPAMQLCYLHPIWRIENFRRCALRQKSDDKLVNRIQQKYNYRFIVFAFGNWTGGYYIRGFAPAPGGKHFRRLLRRRGMPCIVINEFRTSGWCYNCGTKMDDPEFSVDEHQCQQSLGPEERRQLREFRHLEHINLSYEKAYINIARSMEEHPPPAGHAATLTAEGSVLRNDHCQEMLRRKQDQINGI
ncbi:hypothetical protein EDD86DRAFT_19932 [Gorgonomyces haynaldii]|nr:hypothetical protein EDD86DRAFT_19932 [Gorgonomyces haynaldii]